MKVGYRKPSVKKSISARTTGKISRSINKATNPLYGKAAMLKDPKKTVYNKVYSKTTKSMFDTSGDKGSSSRGSDYIYDDFDYNSLPSNTNACFVYNTKKYEKNIEQLGKINPIYSYTKKRLIKENIINERITKYSFEPIKTELKLEDGKEYYASRIEVIANGLLIGHVHDENELQLKEWIKSNKIKEVTARIICNKYKELIPNDKDESGYELKSINRTYRITIIIEQRQFKQTSNGDTIAATTAYNKKYNSSLPIETKILIICFVLVIIVIFSILN